MSSKHRLGNISDTITAIRQRRPLDRFDPGNRRIMIDLWERDAWNRKQHLTGILIVRPNFALGPAF
jgi:hypothetical protein